MEDIINFINKLWLGVNLARAFFSFLVLMEDHALASAPNVRMETTPIYEEICLALTCGTGITKPSQADLHDTQTSTPPPSLQPRQCN